MNADVTLSTSKATGDDIFKHLSECNNDFDPPLSEKVNIKDYAQKIFENAITFEAWNGTHLSGLIAAYFNDKERKTGYITNVSVTPDQKNKGLASVLMDRCIVYARENGFATIRLEVSSGNRKALTLYRKFKFSDVQEIAGNLVMQHIIEDK